MKRILIASLLAGFVCLLTGCGHATTDASANTNPSPVTAPAASDPNVVTFAPDSAQLKQIRTEAVQSAPVPVGSISAPGKIEANANRLSHVVLPLAGRITSVEVKVGDFVHQGQPLLTLESPDADVAISTMLQAQAALTQAKAVATKADKDYDREKDLLEHGAVAQKEVLNAEAVVIQAKTGIEQANASLQQSKRKLVLLGLPTENFGQKVTVNAPISGKILDLTVVNGEFRNDLSASLMTIADLSSVWLSSDVPETAIRFVKNGEPVRLELAAYPDESFRGRVMLIGDTVDPQSRTIKVRAELQNPDGRLKPEMFGNIQLAEHTENRPTVPTAAIIASEGQPMLWRETGPGQFAKTPVKTGLENAGRVAVLEGLQPNDRVVVDGVMLLQAK